MLPLSVLLLLSRAEWSFPATAIKLHIGFVQDAEHAAPTTKSRLLENFINGESFEIHVDNTLVTLGTPHRFVANALNMLLYPAYMVRGLTDSVCFLRQQGNGGKHVTCLRSGKKLVARINPVTDGHQSDVLHPAELQKEDELPRTTQSIRPVSYTHLTLPTKA